MHHSKNCLGFISDENLTENWPNVEQFWDSGESGHFLGVSGLQIHYIVFKRENEKGAIVISSGRTESYFKYKELIYNFSKVLNYSIYIHDHRGQGLSDRMLKNRHKGHVENFDHYIADLRTFYETRIEPNGHQQLFLLGHSMGSTIAARYLQQYPDDFTAAALSSPMCDLNIGYSGRLVGRIAYFARWFPRCLDFGKAFAFSQKEYRTTAFVEDDPLKLTHSRVRFEHLKNFSHELLESLSNQLIEKLRLGGVTWKWLYEALSASNKMLLDAAKIQTPVMVMQAGRDVVVTAKGQKRFFDALNIETSTKSLGHRFVVIPGGFHELFVETDEYRLNALNQIASFYDENKKT